MTLKKTAFCQNLAKLVASLGMDHKLLYRTKPGERKPSKRAVEKILHGRVEPRSSTKKMLVDIIRDFVVGEANRLSVADLENPGFDLQVYLFKGKPAAKEMFDVDFLKTEIKDIVESARTKGELIQRLLSIRIEAAKVQFWDKIHEKRAGLGVELKVFNEALRLGGMPDGLPLRRGTLLDYAKSISCNSHALSSDHQLLWKIAAAVYPATGGADPELKKPARYLAWFWNHSICSCRTGPWGISIVPDLARRKDSEARLVHLLSWLELPLVLQTENLDKGKTGLFELGRCLQQQEKLLERG